MTFKICYACEKSIRKVPQYEGRQNFYTSPKGHIIHADEDCYAIAELKEKQEAKK